MVIDLSYAKAPKEDKTKFLALSVQGWNIGWASFEGEDAKAIGHVQARSHVEGKVVPSYQRLLGMYSHLVKLAKQIETRVIVSAGLKTDAPLWTLPPTLALMIGAVYGDIPDWEEQIKKDMNELRSWATLLLGKAPDNDLEVSALGIGTVATLGRRPGAIQNQQVNTATN